MQFSQVFQVFIVINFASMSIGRSTSALLDYNVAKAAALRILTICNQKSLIDPDNGNGIKLVGIHLVSSNKSFLYCLLIPGHFFRQD